MRETGSKSQSAFMRGFIDDGREDAGYEYEAAGLNPRSCAASSMTSLETWTVEFDAERLNPRSCAASSMTQAASKVHRTQRPGSQSAFMRGFIDDFRALEDGYAVRVDVSIRVHARLHR